MSFSIKNNNTEINDNSLKEYALIQHRTGAIGCVLSILKPAFSKDTFNIKNCNIGVAVFTKENTQRYANWRVQDCILFNGEINLKNK